MSPAPCRKVTKTPSQLLRVGLGMDKWWPSKKPSQPLEGEVPPPTAAAGGEAAPHADALEGGKGKPAASGHVVEMSADSRSAPGLPAADGSTPVAWTAHSSGENLPASADVACKGGCQLGWAHVPLAAWFSGEQISSTGFYCVRISLLLVRI